jgi:single-strand DNA-binding protein
MALNLNKVALVGRLTKEIEVKKTQSGLSVAQFSVAIDRMGKNGEVDFINCVAWRQSADFLGQYAKKGDTVSVDGRINQRTYTTQDGQNRTVFEVIAENVSLQSKQSGTTATAQTNADYQQSTQNEYTGEFSNEDNFF